MTRTARLFGGTLLFLASCTSILGIDSPGAADMFDASSGGPDAAAANPDFTFAIVPANVTVPRDGGFNLIDLQVTRTGGFTGDIVVDVKDPAPTGLEWVQLTIPAGVTNAQLHVNAGGALTIGTPFMLDLVAVGGDKTHEDSVLATVTGWPGTLDVAFDDDGLGDPVITSNDGGEIYDIFLQADQAILATGFGYGLANKASRIFFPDDGALGTDSIFNFCGCSNSELGRGVVRLTNDNTVWMIRNEDDDNIVLRNIRPNESGEQGFGQNGTLLLELGINEDPIGMAAMPNDTLRILYNMAGVSNVAALDPGGNPDGAFDGDANVTLPLVVGGRADAMAIANGKIYVTGDGNPADADLGVVRLDATTGALDATWGSAGLATVPGGGVNEAGFALKVLPDGSAMVAVLVEGNVGVRHLLPSGQLDMTFGTDGLASPTTPLGGLVAGIDVQLDGRVIVALAGGQVLRFMPDGRVDPTYGVDGVATVSFGADVTVINGIVIGSDGKLRVVGSIGTFPVKNLVARLWF